MGPFNLIFEDSRHVLFGRGICFEMNLEEFLWRKDLLG